MTTTILGQLSPENLEFRKVDLALFSCGYESRARAFIESGSFPGARQVAFLFGDHRELAFTDNLEAMGKAGVEILDISDNSIVLWLGSALEFQGKANTEPCRVFIDISSQSRKRLALIVEGLVLASKKRPIQVFFGYTVAQFTPPQNIDTLNVDIEPITPYYTGWPRDPSLPVSLLVGLGYEPDRALGVRELLEPEDVWALLPHSPEVKYDQSLLDANKQLIDQLADGRLVRYEVDDPNSTLATLAALTTKLRRRASVVVLPSGPKILVLLSLLMASVHRDIAVWRVSAGTEEPPVDRKDSGLRVVIESLFEHLE